MYRDLKRATVVACIALMGAAGVASAQVGEPFGPFDITITQGGNLIAQDTVIIGPGGDLEDLKASWQDGDPEDFTQIGTVGLPGQETPIILKITTDDDPYYRISHWYIDVPVSLGDIDTPGPTSLFDPDGGDIDVTITGLSFDNGAAAIPFVEDNNSFGASFMRDWVGHFYEVDRANAYDTYGNGIYDIQVPGEVYMEDDLSPYDFEALQSGRSASWTWGDLVNPGRTTTVHDGTTSGVTPQEPGYVYELGLAVAFIVPEPGTVGVLLAGCVPLLLRRRHR